MADREIEEYINDIKGKLPLPSEVPSEDLQIPFGIYGYNEELGTPLYGSLTFTKDIHNGIVIGWKLKKE